MGKILIDGIVTVVESETIEGTVTLIEDDQSILDKEDEVRAERNKLLAETDWWALSDHTMTQAQEDYRQALRDITDQSGFPESVTWPTKP